MKIKLLTSMAGDNFSHSAGEIIDMEEKQAARFIEKGLAEPVKKEKVKNAKHTG